jgi:hypothetical protein
MVITLGIRLVVIFPTLLFLLGCCFRSILEKNDFEKVGDINEKIGEKLQESFLIILSIDSLFLFIANGLIIIFEFESAEIGTIALIIGVILSISSIIGVISDHIPLTSIGLLAIFGALGGELVYFSIIDTTITNRISEPIAVIIGIFLGFILGYVVIALAIPEESNVETPSAVSIEK